ncbi:MAG: phosphotransferase [Propionibacteriales bacterium]|nr:phosphotransferase [Propionibacteriales bacterium]
MRELAAYLERVVGACSVVPLDVPGNSHVLEAVDVNGDRWFAKRLGDAGQWRAEVRAYKNWVPALGDRAPRLRAADRQRRFVVTSAVPGRRGDPFDPDLHQAAGELLRRFHSVLPSRTATATEFADRMAQRLERWLGRVPGLFTADEVDFARAQVRLLEQLPLQLQVPCHGDYKPHNWLLDDDGTLRVIDFADSRWHVRAFDLTRLYYGPWWGRPKLVERFLEGYGHQLADHERDFLLLTGPVNAVVIVVWAHLHGQPAEEQRTRDLFAALRAGHSPETVEQGRWRRRLRRAH